MDFRIFPHPDLFVKYLGKPGLVGGWFVVWGKFLHLDEQAGEGSRLNGPTIPRGDCRDRLKISLSMNTRGLFCTVIVFITFIL